LPTIIQVLRDNIVSKDRVLAGFRSLGSIPSMFPKGGDTIWGTEQWNPDNSGTNYMIDFGNYSKNEDESEKLSNFNVTQSCGEVWDEPADLKLVKDTMKKSHTVESTLDFMRKLWPRYMELV